jgi:hypothetical protein
MTQKDVALYCHVKAHLIFSHKKIIFTAFQVLSKVFQTMKNISYIVLK